MFSEIEMDYVPQGILEELPGNGHSGMSSYDLAFLCGAIRKFRPRKVVEIGVSAGGTSAVLLESLRLAEYPCEVYSVDISTHWYIDPNQLTGFMLQAYFAQRELHNVSHRLITGKTIAEAVDEIGEGIDFVIIDTMHSLPGELLDFLSVLPHMTCATEQGATAVFHDVAQPQLGIGHSFGAPMEYASLVTLLAASGEKFIGRDASGIGHFGNIGGIHMQGEYMKWAQNLFFALRMPWDYIPDRKSWYEYLSRICSDYGKWGEQHLLDALELNEFSLYRRENIFVPPPGQKICFCRRYRDGKFTFMVREKLRMR